MPVNELPSLKPIYLNDRIVGEVPATGDVDLDMQTVVKFLEERGLFRETGRIASMLFQAYSFGKTARRIYDLYLCGLPANPIGVAPFVVNGSFALEIYIKTLAEIHGTTLRGHNLSKLYEALDPQIQTLLEQITQGYIKAKNLQGIIGFSPCICAVGNAFEKWRYHYEEGTAPTVDAVDVFLSLDVLHAACARRVRA